MTYQSGQDVTVRGNFLDNGTLPDTQDTDYRAISDDWPVFGFGMISEPQFYIKSLIALQQMRLEMLGALLWKRCIPLCMLSRMRFISTAPMGTLAFLRSGPATSVLTRLWYS